MAESPFTLQTVQAANNHKDLRVETTSEQRVHDWMAMMHDGLPCPETGELLLLVANRPIAFAKPVHLFLDQRIKAPEGGALLTCCLIGGCAIKTSPVTADSFMLTTEIVGELHLEPQGTAGLSVRKDQPVAVVYPVLVPKKYELIDVAD